MSPISSIKQRFPFDAFDINSCSHVLDSGCNGFLLIIFGGVLSCGGSDSGSSFICLGDLCGVQWSGVCQLQHALYHSYTAKVSDNAYPDFIISY